MDMAGGGELVGGLVRVCMWEGVWGQAVGVYMGGGGVGGCMCGGQENGVGGWVGGWDCN